MLGDVLIINDLHKEAAKELKEIVLQELKKKKDNYRFIVGISGESGSGKSELAHCLGLELKEDDIIVKIIHTDNYYHIHPRKRKEFRDEHGLDTIGLDEYDWVKLNRTINDFKDKQESVMPCIDLISETVDRLITDFKKVELLIIDGLYAIKARSVDLKVFIDLTYHETKISQLVRLKEAMDEKRLEILKREHLSVISLKPMSDIIIDKVYQVVRMEDYDESRYLIKQE